MAKKDGKEGEEGYEFSIPDFDEDAFIHKEMVSFRTTSILFGVGIVTALISWGLFEALGGATVAWFLGLAIMAVSAYLLRFIYPALKVDIRHFGRREWFGTFFLTFFAWLAFFILFINPPISDHADPTVDVFASPTVQITGGDVLLDIFVADNYQIEDQSFSIGFEGGSLTDVTAQLTADADIHGHFTYLVSTASSATYQYAANAIDSKGNTASITGTFVVGDNAISVVLPEDDTLEGTKSILVQLAQGEPCTEVELFDGGNCVRGVELALENGDSVVLEHNDDFDGWIATANYAGWAPGPNTFDVKVTQQDRFQGIHRVPGGISTVGPFTVDVPSGGGDKTVEVPDAPTQSPALRRTPGFETVVLIAVLGGAALVARRRQE